MLVVIRGAGDLASGIALRLWRSHIKVVMTDVERPTAIRRTVCFSQAIVHGEAAVEGVTARRAASPAEALALLREDGIMSLCIYYGRETGFAERDALLAYLRTIDSRQYTVMICEFANRSNCPPIPVLIWKGK